MRVLRSNAGQGSIEYVGLIAVVAALVVVSGAALAQASDVSRRVTRQFARALCVVRGGDCERDREPCVVSSHSDRRLRSGKLVVIRLSRGRTALVERRSDGTVAVTWTKEDATGLSGELGVGGSVRALGLDIALGGELRAGGLATGRGGRTWIVPSTAAAEALVAQLEDDAGDGGLPPPDLVYRQDDEDDSYGAFLTARAGAGDVGVDLAEAGGELALRRSTGARLDRRTGHRTFYARASSSVSARAQAAGGVLGIGASSSTTGELYALEVDEHGRPLDLAVVAAGRFDGTADLPAVLSPVAGRLAGATKGTRLVEVTTHLDLTHAANLAAAREMMWTLRRGQLSFGRLLAAQRGLRRRLEAAGTVEARVLDASTTTGGWSVEAAALGKVGLEKVHDVHDLRLVAAVSRGLDGQWLARDDCVAAA